MSFAVRIVKLYKYLTETKKEFILSKQLMKSGTSIGANAYEANQAQTKKDFVAKMYISLKEAAETGYWLELLFKAEYLAENEFLSIKADCNELIKLLTAIIKTSKIQ
jgi:four helix bundle protein